MAYIEDPRGDYKAISVETLVRLVGELQPADQVAANNVGNLLILRDSEPVGFVDFGVEGTVIFDRVDSGSGS